MEQDEAPAWEFPRANLGHFAGGQKETPPKRGSSVGKLASGLPDSHGGVQGIAGVVAQ
jgi:hypothetical protein